MLLLVTLAVQVKGVTINEFALIKIMAFSPQRAVPTLKSLMQM